MSQPDPVKEAQRILINGDQSLFGTLPVVIKNMIEDRCWETRNNKEGQPFPSLRAMIEYPLYWGLETPLDDLIYFCRKDKDCVRLLEGERGELGSVGRPVDNVCNSNIKVQGERGELGSVGRPVDNVCNSNIKVQGGTTDYTKRRLKRDRPDLYDQVISQQITANAAAIMAGFRKPPARLNTPETALDAITSGLKADDRVSAVIELLNALKPAEFRAVQLWLSQSKAA